MDILIEPGTRSFLPGKYDSISPFSDGLAVVQNGSDEDIRQDTAKFGFVDKTGKVVVAVGTYSFAKPFSEGVAAVRTGVGQGARYTFIDRSGLEVPRLGRYVYAESFSNGFARVNPRGDVKNGYGFIDLDGKEIVPPRYDSKSEVLSAGLIRVCRQVEVARVVTIRCGVVNKSGKEIVPFGKYDSISPFSDGLAFVTIGFNENEQSGFIDELGNEFIPPGKFPGGIGRGFFEGYLVACATTTNCFLIDRTGRRIASLPPKMTPSDYFDVIREEMIRFSSGSKWGFIDRSGSVIVPAKYDFVSRFSDGVSFVCVSRGFRECGFIEKSGKQLTPLKYDRFINNEFLTHYQFNGSIAGRDIESVFVEFEGALQQVRVGVGENGKWGFIDRTGREIVSPKYEKVWCWALKKEGLVGIVLDGRKGFVDRYGNEYFDF